LYSNKGKNYSNDTLKEQNMCTLTKECFKYLAQQKYPSKEISNSQKLNQFAKDFGYKSYNSILKTIGYNKPDFDLKLIFPDSVITEEIDYMKEAEIHGFSDRYYHGQIDAELFDEVLEFSIMEKDNFLYGEEFLTEELLFSAKSIRFAIPSNVLATLSCQSFNYYALLDDTFYSEEEKDEIMESHLNKMVVNGDMLPSFGATADALYYQHEKTISSIKNIKDAENISFFVLNDIKFVEDDEDFLESSLETLFYAFIHRYMRFDRATSTSFAVEIPFSKDTMTKEQFDTVEWLIRFITQSSQEWGKIFTKPVHLNYSDFDKDMTYSYLFFTRKDIDGDISHTQRDRMSCYQD